MNNHVLDIQSYLTRCIQDDTLSHAYLFTGAASDDRDSLGSWLIETLSPSEIIRIGNSIVDVREARSRIAHTTFDGGRRVVMCERADQLTPEAGNALLVSIEEPPAHTMFVLFAPHEKSVLPTIASRCSRIRCSSQHVGELPAEEGSGYRQWLSALDAPLWQILHSTDESNNQEEISLAKDELYIHHLLRDQSSPSRSHANRALKRFDQLRELYQFPSLQHSRTTSDRLIVFQQ